MKNDRVTELYIAGRWLELAEYLEEKISYFAELGDEVQLARSLSYYGLISLLFDDRHTISTIYKQIDDESVRNIEDVRIKAVYARFLGLYHFASGDIAKAAICYEDSYKHYSELDWYTDEAVMILESLCCFQLFPEHRSMLCRGLNRLKKLNNKMGGSLEGEISFIEKLFAGAPANGGRSLRDEGDKPLSSKCFFCRFTDSLSKLCGFEEEQYVEQNVKFKIALFGEFSIQLGDKRLHSESWKNKQSKELLIYLLLHPYGQLPKEQVIEQFFTGENLNKSVNRLYVTIHRINRTLQESFGISREVQLVQTQQGAVRLNQELLEEVDVHTYRKLQSVSEQLWNHDLEASVDLIARAAKLYSAALALGVHYLDWLEQYREEMQSLQVKAVRRLARFYREKNDCQSAEEAYLQLLHLDPFDEGIYEEYIGYLVAMNRQAEACRLYRKLKRELEREFGVAPSFQVDNLLRGS